MLFNDNRLLFVDSRHIESVENVELTMNPPRKAGPCLHVETEWERRGCRPYSVVQFKDEFRLYYKTRNAEGEPALAFAVSTDGINWTRPDLGKVSWNGSKSTNIVDIDGCDPNEICVFVDPNGPDEHRFKAVVHRPEEGGMYLLTSPDGTAFKRADGFLLEFIVDNCNTTFYDERIGRYVVYARGCDRDYPKPPIEGCRSVIRVETDDLFKPLPYDANAPLPWHVAPRWSDNDDKQLRRINKEIPIVLECDEYDHPAGEFYQIAAVHYLPDVYLAFPSFYYRYPWPPEHRYINDGLLDLQFACSTDGIEWRRDFRDSYVRLDLPDGAATKMMHMITGVAPHGSIISQYHILSRRSHGEGRLPGDVPAGKNREKLPEDPIKVSGVVGRVEQRMDGFVSADSAYTGGTLITKPFTIQSDSLRLNIDTSASGVAHAALLDESGSAIPGFGLEDCDRIQGNDTQWVVSWKADSNVSSLKGKQVKLLLRSRSAKLFAIYP